MRNPPPPPGQLPPPGGSGRSLVPCLLRVHEPIIWLAVSRVLAHSDFFGMDMVLDINSDIYPVKVRSATTSPCHGDVWHSTRKEFVP